MVRNFLVGFMAALLWGGPAFALQVRVVSFAQSFDDKIGTQFTAALQKSMQAKGVLLATDEVSAGVLEELKTRNLVAGETLDEIKGLASEADYVVIGGLEPVQRNLKVKARLIEMESGAVLGVVEDTGGVADLTAVAERLATKLVAALPRGGVPAKGEVVAVQVLGMGPNRTVALLDAKRNAVELAVGAMVDVKKIPDLKTVRATAQSTLAYRIVNERQEGGKTFLTIAAQVEIPAEMAAKYPAPAKALSDETGFRAYIERSAKGEIDWSKGILRVVGRARVSASDAKAQLQARRAAVADAYARALEVVAGVRIDSDTTISEAQKKDRQIALRIEGLVKGGTIVKDTPAAPNGMYEVTLEVPMLGLRGVQSVFLDRLGTPQHEEEARSVPAETDTAFTGIIIDARKTGLQAGMFPKLLDEQGNVIADPAQSDREILKAKGQAAFVVGDPDAALLWERVGPRPLYFRVEAMPDASVEPGAYQVASLAPVLIGQPAPTLTRNKLRQGPQPLRIKGLQPNGTTKVNLMVSTNYKDKEKFQQQLKRLFGKCRVVVVMDSQIGGTEGRLDKGLIQVSSLVP